MGDIHSWVNSFGIVLTLLLSIFLAWRAASRGHEREIAEMKIESAAVKVKVDTMWGFLMKRAVVEGVDKGLMTMNSPVRLEPHSAELFIHLADELHEFYA